MSELASSSHSSASASRRTCSRTGRRSASARPGRRGFFTRQHAHYWTVVAAGLTHPSVWHAIRDYVTHLIIYSGYVLPTHG
jgi:hypothetical protein